MKVHSVNKSAKLIIFAKLAHRVWKQSLWTEFAKKFIFVSYTQLVLILKIKVDLVFVKIWGNTSHNLDVLCIA